MRPASIRVAPSGTTQTETLDLKQQALKLKLLISEIYSQLKYISLRLSLERFNAKTLVAL